MIFNILILIIALWIGLVCQSGAAKTRNEASLKPCVGTAKDGDQGNLGCYYLGKDEGEETPKVETSSQNVASNEALAKSKGAIISTSGSTGETFVKSGERDGCKNTDVGSLNLIS